MNIFKRLFGRKHWKQNPVECAFINIAQQTTDTPTYSDNSRQFATFLNSNYGITNVKPIAGAICNNFWIGTDKDGTKLFIKTTKHAGICENEYRMGLELYNIDHEHFIRPVYWGDHGEIQFFANEYLPGISLNTAIMTNSLSVADKSRLIGDIWRIFCALRQSDVVHRDIRPDNFVIADGRLILIDFQLAVSKSNYVELEYLAKHKNRLRKLGNKKYRYRLFRWDDAYSLLKVMQFIGRDKFYATRYDVIYKNIRKYVGRATIKSSVRENELHRIARHIRKMKI